MRDASQQITLKGSEIAFCDVFAKFFTSTVFCDSRISEYQRAILGKVSVGENDNADPVSGWA
jgi:hypothetical protein